MKVLVLTCVTGTGHNAAGRAVYEEFQARGIPCEFLDIFSFIPEKDRHKAAVKAAHLYASMTMPTTGILRTPGSLRNVGYPRHKKAVQAFNSSYVDALGDYLLEHDFDTVVTPHIFPACALTQLKKQGVLAAMFYVLVTQYDALDAWKDTNPDYLVVPHQDLIRPFLKLGFQREKIYTLGIPLPLNYSQRRPQDEVRQVLELPLDGKMILIMANALPVAQVKRMIPPLRRIYGPRLIMVFLADPLRPINKQLLSLAEQDERLIVRDHLEDFSLYLDAADVLISRPTGLLAVEAAAKHVPVILLDPLPGLEQKNAEFLSRHKMATLIHRPSDLMLEIQTLIENELHRSQMLENQQAMVRPDDAARICYFISSSSQ